MHSVKFSVLYVQHSVCMWRVQLFVSLHCRRRRHLSMCYWWCELFYNRVTTCLENLEMSGNLKHVREMSGMLLTVREMSGEKSCHGKIH